MSDTVSILVNGAEVKAKKGQTIMEAADAAGIYIPHLCSHPDLPAGGHCRLCTVMVNGRPSSSCTYAVTDGLVIETDTEELQAHRRVILEMLFVEGNHYLPVVRDERRVRPSGAGLPAGLLTPTCPYLHPVARHRRLAPGRATSTATAAFCATFACVPRRVDGKHVFGIGGRGIKSRLIVNSASGRLADTNLSVRDRAAEVCPTGAIIPQASRLHGADRPAALRPPRHRRGAGGGHREAQA